MVEENFSEISDVSDDEGHFTTNFPTLPTYRKKFIDSIVKSLHGYFSEDEFQDFTILDPAEWHNLDVDNIGNHGTEKLQSIMVSMGYDVDLLPVVVAQFHELQRQVKQDPLKRHCETSKDPVHVQYSHLLATYSVGEEFQAFIRACIVLPSSSSSVERLFSHVGLVANSVRGSRIEAEGMENIT